MTELYPSCGQVPDKQTIGENRAGDGLILVVVRVDKSRHDDHIGAVDDLAVCAEVRADGLDLGSFDQHIGLFQVAPSRVHGQDHAAFKNGNAFVAAVVDRSQSLIVVIAASMGKPGEGRARKARCRGYASSRADRSRAEQSAARDLTSFRGLIIARRVGLSCIFVIDSFFPTVVSSLR